MAYLYEGGQTSPAYGYGISPEEMAQKQQAYARADAASSKLGSDYNTIKRTPPIDRLFQAIDLLSKAASVSNELANAMCGSEPTNSDDSEAPQRIGLFGSIEDAADRISRMASVVLTSASRISSRAGGS